MTDSNIYNLGIKIGIRFALSRMGLQFTAAQEDKYAENIFNEYLRIQTKKDNIYTRNENEKIPDTKQK